MIASLRSQGVDFDADPHVIFHHADEAIGPEGADEWMAIIRDSEGNLVGLVNHSAPE